MNFFVSGTPKPQGRPRAFIRGGFSKVYSPMTEWKEKVQYHSEKQRGESHFFHNEALEVELKYYFKHPKNHYRTGKNAGLLKDWAKDERVTKRPDLDNLNKAILDAMQTAKLINDDSYIVKLTSSKQYSTEREGVWIIIKSLDSDLFKQEQQKGGSSTK